MVWGEGFPSSTANLWAKSGWQRIALVTDHTRSSAQLLTTVRPESPRRHPPCLSEEKTGLLHWIRATVGNYGLPWLLAKFTHWPSPTGNYFFCTSGGKSIVTSNLEDRLGLFKEEEASITNREIRLLLIPLSSLGGGQGGIRTHGTVSSTHAFQACSLNHSDTCPWQSLAYRWARMTTCASGKEWQMADFKDDFLCRGSIPCSHCTNGDRC